MFLCQVASGSGPQNRYLHSNHGHLLVVSIPGWQNSKQPWAKNLREFRWESCARPGSVAATNLSARGAFGHFGLVAAMAKTGKTNRPRKRISPFKPHVSVDSRIPHSRVLDKVSLCLPWEALLSQKLSPDLSLFQDDHCSVGFSLSVHSFCQPRKRNISQGMKA